jgi:chemotaxis protein MotB
MKRIVYLLVVAISLSSITSSCVVSKKKFDELLAEKVKQDAQVTQLENQVAELTTKVDGLEELLASTTSDRDKLDAELTETVKLLDDLQAEHDQLQTYYNNALSNSGKLNRDLTEQQERLLALQESLKQQKYEGQLLSDSLALREARVAELEQVLQQSREAVEELKNKVIAALTNFGKGELTIEQRNGRVYVSLSEQLLFKSGSITVDPKGVNALKKLAEALKDSPEIKVVVEGHTDDVPISRGSKYMTDNWDLSVMCATSIVRILVNGGVAPEALTAAGKGEFYPVASNNSAENKQLNRRTDIVLTPDFSELLDMLDY